MKKFKDSILPPDEVVIDKIYKIGTKKVMIDRDLAELYGVETKRLKEAVRRNISRFPPDFMFEMSAEEFEILRTQFASSKSGIGGLRYAPYCFTEQGVTMLSCILNSERAIAVNIQIIRIFTKMKEILVRNKQILLQLEKIESKLTGHDEDIKVIFEYLKKLLHPERQRIGFRRNNE
ncbi:MAG: ORF6N domain-containing protein [Bacteroidetes bacterium]|nr:ORF6N domain-containing protein [Bacteroidota bacterium]